MEKSVTVYLVEDYNLTRVALRYILSDFENIELIGESEDAYDGLEKIFILKPDVVLMDMGLPGMNGIEATQKIKDMLPETKVIILTSHDKESEVLAALGSGATGYCLKNIQAERLCNAIKGISLGDFWLDSSIAKSVMKYFPKPEDISDLKNLEIIDSKYRLSKRELDILKLLTAGKSNLEIAQEMFFSVHTAKAHVCNILKKLSVDDRIQAAVKAVREKLV